MNWNEEIVDWKTIFSAEGGELLVCTLIYFTVRDITSLGFTVLAYFRREYERADSNEERANTNEAESSIKKLYIKHMFELKK